jgi:fibronectin-binding autotransporter adhesin
LVSSFDIADGTASSDMTVSGTLANGGVTKLGAGTLTFSGGASNSYTGLTTISNGTLVASKSPGQLSIPGDVLINGGTLSVTAPDNIADTSTVTMTSGTFNMAAVDTIGSLVFNGGTITGASTLTLTSTASTALSLGDGVIVPFPITFSSSGGLTYTGVSTGSIISGPLDLGSFLAHSININDGGDAIDLDITNVISGAGSSVTLSTGQGTLRYSGASPNTYSGLTTVTSGTLLLNKTAGVNAVAGDITVNGGTLKLGGTNQIIDTSYMTLSSGVFDMGGNAETIKSLTFNGGTLSQGGATLSLNSAGIALSVSGGTLIDGALALTGGGSIFFDSTSNGTATLSSTSTLDLGGGATVFDVSDGTSLIDMEMNGVISNGGVTKNGAGLLSLGGTNTYLGPTTINSGTLSVIGDIQTSTVVVNSGGLLKGIGTVGATTVHSGGTIHPGTSMGVLTVAGPLVLSGTTEIEISFNPDPTYGNTSSRIAITGAGATLGGNLIVLPEIGIYYPDDTWTIVQTDGAPVTGTFNFFLPPTKLPSLSIDYSMASSGIIRLLNMSIAVLGRINLAALSGNNLVLAEYLNTLLNTSSSVPLLQTLIHLVPLSGSALKEALSSISPLRVASTTWTTLNTQFEFISLLSNHLQNRRLLDILTSRVEEDLYGAFQNFEEKDLLVSAEEGYYRNPSSSRSNREKYSLWTQGFGQFADQKGDDTNPSFGVNSGGVVMAFEYLDVPFLTFGGGLGYAQSALHERDNFGRGHSNTYLSTIYADFVTSHFFADLALLGSFTQTQNKRHVFFPNFHQTATSSTNSWQLTPHLAFGYTITSSKIAIQPFASFDWANQFGKSFDEHGAGPINMHVSGKHSSMLRSELGLSFYEKKTCRWGSIIAKQRMSYINKTPFSVGIVNAAIIGASGSFTVETFTHSQNLFSPLIEFICKFNRGGFASLFYQGEFGQEYTSHTIVAKAGVDF